MRRMLTLTLVAALMPLAAHADADAWKTEIHAEAMSKANAYRIEGRTKVMVACIQWPWETGATDPSIQFLVTRMTSPSSDGPVPVNRLRRNAMSDCLRRASGGCDCATLDESGRNVLRVPSP